MKKILFIPLLFLLSGCVSSSGVINIGPDKYQISREDGARNRGAGSLKDQNLKEAKEYCEKQKKQINVIKSDGTSGFMDFARADIEFTCI